MLRPRLLADWIARDRLKCLKVKLRGTDAAWDYARLVTVGQIGLKDEATVTIINKVDEDTAVTDVNEVSEDATPD